MSGRKPKVAEERVAFRVRSIEMRQVRKLARIWRVDPADVLRLAVWAYVLPWFPSLAAPCELPDFEKSNAIFKAEVGGR